MQPSAVKLKRKWKAKRKKWMWKRRRKHNSKPRSNPTSCSSSKPRPNPTLCSSLKPIPNQHSQLVLLHNHHPSHHDLKLLTIWTGVWEMRETWTEHGEREKERERERGNFLGVCSSCLWMVRNQYHILILFFSFVFLVWRGERHKMGVKRLIYPSF